MGSCFGEFIGLVVAMYVNVGVDFLDGDFMGRFFNVEYDYKIE